jgi:radical SAM superfamily enzyme YgiQ (UPF0313 family)
MNILFVSPETPTTFWSFRNALKFVSKKSSEPPLGLLTVAAMLPQVWNKKLIDLNVSPLKDEHLNWADYVFLTGMNVHISSMKRIITRCNQVGVKVVLGGPLATLDPEQFLGVDHFVLGEVENIIAGFVKDLENGTAKNIYKSVDFPDISNTPIPMWNLLEMNKYVSMSVQYSRGCPFDCEFCGITLLNGHKPRTKGTAQFIAELESLYQLGWRSGVFIVDDNFIGNKKKLKSEVMPALIEWSKERKYPFAFGTEASINLADDDTLVQQMAEAGFDHTFIGIETPNTESLLECGKSQNSKRDMVDSVKKLQRHGIIVSGGFIVGFDNDSTNIFKQQINFIQNSGIVTAMVGLLNAPSGTRLFQRMKSEKRLLNIMSGDNMDGTMNFIPKMNYQKLVQGYKEILETIYSPKEFYDRVKTFLTEYHRPFEIPTRLSINHIKALFKSMWVLGIVEKGKRYYWKLFMFGLFKHPKKFPLAITMAIYGFHFRRVTEAV